MLIYGGFAGHGAPDPDAHDPRAYVTVLSGDLNGDDQPGFVNRADNCYHVIASNTVGDLFTLDGFTISGGNANGSGNDGRGARMEAFLELPSSSDPGELGILAVKNPGERGRRIRRPLGARVHGRSCRD